MKRTEEQKLVDFFNSPEGMELGIAGDYDDLTPAETAIRAMRKALRSKRKKHRNGVERPAFLRGARWMLSELSECLSTVEINAARESILDKSSEATQRKAGRKS